MIRESGSGVEFRAELRLARAPEEFMSHSGKLLVQTLTAIAILAAFSALLSASAPHGWLLAGSKPAGYDTGVDPAVKHNNIQSAYLKSKPTLVPDEKVFGTLMQNFRATQYPGKRVRFSGFVKAEEVKDWAGLWMRIDKYSSVVGFDNMQDRPIKGTNDWREYAVVLDVPPDATNIAFGILLSQSGVVWLNSANFEVVDSNVEVTGKKTAAPDR